MRERWKHVYFYAVNGADDATRLGYLERAYSYGQGVRELRPRAKRVVVETAQTVSLGG